jgi:hypothetical protein
MSDGLEGRSIRPSNSLLVFKSLHDQVRHQLTTGLVASSHWASFLKEAL